MSLAACATDMLPLRAGEIVEVADRVWRIVAGNASMMTGPGTNSYLLGNPPSVVVDPGPRLDAHLATIDAACTSLAAVLVTHTHNDHSPGAHVLAGKRGCRLIGREAPPDGYQDRSFSPDHEPGDGEILRMDDVELRAIHTPGHASNHVCYLHEASGMLFSGDHILDGVTPVIVAPDGNMRDYIASLERLKTHPITAIAPGHGHVLRDPGAQIDGIIAHRMRREAKVVERLRDLAGATIPELVSSVYDDVPADRHDWAQKTLAAHLFKLEQDGLCVREGERWHVR
ncbi:MAG: MBL fold metallo-hydrolase [Steroidobacteraceae bacterium]